MSLCRPCEEIAHALSLPKNDPYPHTFHTRTTKLSTSAKSCHVCRMIERYIELNDGHGDRAIFYDWQRPGEIEMVTYQTTGREVASASLAIPATHCMPVRTDAGSSIRRLTISPRRGGVGSSG